MSILTLFRRRDRRPRTTRPAGHADLFRVPGLDGGPGIVIPPVTGDAPTVVYEPHGIDTAETLAAIVAKAQEDSRTAQESAETEQWGEWDEPGTAPARTVPDPPPMPFSGVSRIMVDRIPSPEPVNLSYDSAHNYAQYLRAIGAATGTSTSLEDTGMWPRLALEPGDGTGVRL